MPPRVSTAERLLSLFQEKRDLWLGEWAREFEEINLPTGSEGKRVNDRKKPCWLHIDDKLGKCLDCIRGVVGEMKVRECSRSRGVADEEFALRPPRPFSKASILRRTLVRSTRSNKFTPTRSYRRALANYGAEVRTRERTRKGTSDPVQKQQVQPSVANVIECSRKLCFQATLKRHNEFMV